MKHLFLIALLALTACTKQTLTSTTTSVDSNARLQGHETALVDFIVYDSCTAEWVFVQATLEYKYNYFDVAGNFHAKACYQLKDAHGVGLSTENEYRVIGQEIDIERLMDLDGAAIFDVRIKTKLTFITKGSQFVVKGYYKLEAEQDVVKTLIETQNSYCK